jgi:Signal recognition particle GTPase
VFDSLSDKLQSALGDLRKRGKLDEESISRAMREIRLALLEADVNFTVVRDFVAHVRERAMGEEVLKSLTPGQQVVKVVHDELTELMGSGESGLAFGKFTVILLAGLQGSGKTTTAAKLARLLKAQGRKPGLVAADLQRPPRSTSSSSSARRSTCPSTAPRPRTQSRRRAAASSARAPTGSTR